MITCVVDYTIDPTKVAEFERFARRWIELVNEHDCSYCSYFLPAEGATDKGPLPCSASRLAAYERYRELYGVHPDLMAADAQSRYAMTAAASSATNAPSCTRCYPTHVDVWGQLQVIPAG
jgi:hypothetical protein